MFSKLIYCGLSSIKVVCILSYLQALSVSPQPVWKHPHNIVINGPYILLHDCWVLSIETEVTSSSGYYWIINPILTVSAYFGSRIISWAIFKLPLSLLVHTIPTFLPQPQGMSTDCHFTPYICFKSTLQKGSITTWLHFHVNGSQYFNLAELFMLFKKCFGLLVDLSVFFTFLLSKSLCNTARNILHWL